VNVVFARMLSTSERPQALSGPRQQLAQTITFGTKPIIKP
jgi:hypothetical protein